MSIIISSHEFVKSRAAIFSRCPASRSVGELKMLETVQFLFDPALQLLARAAADPVPLLQQQLALPAIGLEIDGGNDLVADQHRQREISEQPLLLWHIGLEAMAIAKKQFAALALDDERIERREDVHGFGGGAAGFQRFGTSPM